MKRVYLNPYQESKIILLRVKTITNYILKNQITLNKSDKYEEVAKFIVEILKYYNINIAPILRIPSYNKSLKQLRLMMKYLIFSLNLF